MPPLAPLANLPGDDVPELIQEIAERLIGKTSPASAGRTLQSPLILSGLRIEEQRLAERKGRYSMIRGLEHSTYWAVLRKEVREDVRQQGLEEGLEKEIESIKDFEQMRRLTHKLLQVSS